MASVGTLYRQDSSVFPGSRGVCSEHILRTGSYPESVFHELYETKPQHTVQHPQSRHRLATSYVEMSSPYHGELHLVDGRKVAPQQPQQQPQQQQQQVASSMPPPAPGFTGSRCQVHITATAGTGGNIIAQHSVDGSPTKLASSAIAAVKTPPLPQRALFEAARDHMLADAECGAFSPLSPGGTGSSRRLAELFGLFRNDCLERTITEGPDELLSQVAAEAESGEFDNLGDPSELNDLVSADTTVSFPDTAVSFPPLSSAPSVMMPQLSAPLPAAPVPHMSAPQSAPHMAHMSAGMQMHRMSVGVPMSHMSAGMPLMQMPASMSLQQQQHAEAMHMQQMPMQHTAFLSSRAASMAPAIPSTQIVLAPRSSSVPDAAVPRLPNHVLSGPPSPQRRGHSDRRAAPRRSGLEVSIGGIAKRSGRTASLGDLRRLADEEGATSQRSGSIGAAVSVDDGGAAAAPASKPKPKRASNGERRPRRMTCNYCKTHVTPQWRCGPDGPRTLCNACGVRWGKGKLEIHGTMHPAHNHRTS